MSKKVDFGREELQDALLQLKKTVVNKEPGYKADADEQVDNLLSVIRSELDRRQAQPLKFSDMTSEKLDKLNIKIAGFLSLKCEAELKEQLAATTSLGQKKLWSSKNLYRQLVLLEDQVPRTTGTSPRAWIEAFFFRASAMLPPEKRMVLIPVTAVNPSSSSTLSGLVDYIAVVASQQVSRTIMNNTRLDNLRMRMPTGFFVIEADLSVPSDEVPQAVCRMYAGGKLLQKKVIRGALTNGHEWIFVLLKLNDNYDGASYKRSPVVELNVTKSLDGVLEVLKPWPDVIAAILLHWVEKGFAELEGDDWFEVQAPNT